MQTLMMPGSLGSAQSADPRQGCGHAGVEGLLVQNTGDMILGLAIMVVSQAATVAGIEPFASWNTPICWTGFIVFAGAIVYRARGDSWIRSAPREFAALALVSIPLWLVFEATTWSSTTGGTSACPSTPGCDCSATHGHAAISPAISKRQSWSRSRGAGKAGRQEGQEGREGTKQRSLRFPRSRLPLVARCWSHRSLTLPAVALSGGAGVPRIHLSCSIRSTRGSARRR